MTPSHLALSYLERSKLRSPKFQNLIYHKGAELGPMLLLNINRESYMGSPVALSHLTLSNLKGQSHGHPDLQARHCLVLGYMPQRLSPQRGIATFPIRQQLTDSSIHNGGWAKGGGWKQVDGR